MVKIILNQVIGRQAYATMSSYASCDVGIRFGIMTEGAKIYSDQQRGALHQFSCNLSHNAEIKDGALEGLLNEIGEMITDSNQQKYDRTSIRNYNFAQLFLDHISRWENLSRPWMLEYHLLKLLLIMLHLKEWKNSLGLLIIIIIHCYNNSICIVYHYHAPFGNSCNFCLCTEKLINFNCI